MGPVHADRSFRRRQLRLELGLQQARLAKKRTVVLKIEAPDAPLYWRATVLEEFVDGGWAEDLQTMEPLVFSGERAELVPRR